MNSFSKKTTAFISAALVVGLIAPNVMFPWSGGELGTGEVRADAPLLQDSASQINYATVLGGAVDYGIVAKSIAQKNHMETTFATNHFSNRDDQGNANNNDVDYITSTALFLVGSLEDGDYIRWGYNTASSMYLEAPQDVYGAEDPSQANYFNPAIEPYGGLTNGNIIFDRAYGRTPLIQAVNANATSNVDRLINRIGEKPQEGTPPEDADIAWSYYLQARSAWDSGYVLNPNGWDCEYFTDQHGQALDGSGGGKLNINIDRDEFKNKVVYINLDSVLLQYLTRTSDFIIHKDPSTVVVVNINQDALPDTTSSLKLSKPLVVVDGVEYSGHTATNGGDPTGAGAVQKNFNETVIWNVMAENPVQISTMGGAMLIPNSKDVTIKEGNSSGWIVTGGDLTVRDEFHFLYSGSSRDSYGQMHFAVNKTFTSKYDVQGEVEKDSSIKVKPGDYKFYLQEYTSDDFADEHKYGTPLVKSNDSNSAVIFKSFTFHCEDYDNLTDEQKHYYIEKPTGDDPNSKTFYFRLSEDQNKKVVGIENSDGYIDIILKVDVNKYGKYTYFVNYKSVTGDGIVYRDYAPNDNNDYHLDYIKMSGVQFDLGQFYNKVTSDLTINKVAFAGGKEINNAVLKITRVSGPNTDKSNQDAGYELNIGLSDAQYSHLSKPITAHRTLSDGTVSADFAEAHPGMGPQGNYPQNNQLMFNGTNANHYENSISYRTSSNGPVTIVNLPDGDYTLTEIQTPGGYEHAEEITFSIVGGKVVKCDSANGNTITMLDKKYVEININKVALGAGDEIDGAVLTLTSEDGHDLTNVEIQNCNNTSKNGSSISYTTTAGSVTNLKRLPAGNYTLTENAAPSGFAVQTTVYFTVDENGGITITNDNADEIGTVKDAGGPGNHKTLVMFDAVRVNIRKVNERNDVLNGAQLQIYNADKTAKVGDSFTVGQYSADLAVGNYVLVEEKAPDGYRKAADIAFSVNADGTVKIGDSVQNNNTITMQDLPGLKIKVSKRYYNNGNFDMLNGAQMKITASDGSTGDSTWTWTSDGQAHEITGLSPDVTYRLEEVTPPSGYARIAPIEFTVSVQNYNVRINFTDTSNMLARNAWEYQQGYSYADDGYFYLASGNADHLNAIDDVSTSQQGYIKLTKNIYGMMSNLSASDINDLTFVVTDNEGNEIWRGNLGNDQLFTNTNTEDCTKSYESILIPVTDLSKTYTVTEILTSASAKNIFVSYTVDGIEYTERRDETNRDPITTASFSIAPDETKEIVMNDTYHVMDVRVTKHVEGTDAKDQLFKIVVEFTPKVGETLDWSKILILNPFENNGAHFDLDEATNTVTCYLKADQYINIRRLPVGTTYDAHEDLTGISNYVMSKPIKYCDDNHKVDDLDYGPDCIDVYNKYELAKINITKTIQGNITDEDRNGLTFVVTDEDGNEIWTGELGDTNDFTVDSTGKYTSNDIEVDASKKYTVTEQLTTADGQTLVVKYTVGNGTQQTVNKGTDRTDVTTAQFGVTAGKTTTVAYENDYTPNYDGTIVIEKIFSARTPNNAKKESYTFKIAGPGENVPSNTLYAERVITVTIKTEGKSEMICRNLPYGDYVVTEMDGDVEGFALQISATHRSQILTVENNGVTINLSAGSTAGQSNHNRRIIFENDYVLQTGSISVKKKVTNAADTSKLGDIEFTVEGPAAFNNGKVLTLTYPDNFNTNGVWSQDNVPTGMYTVTETKTGKSETYNCTSTKVNDVAGTSADLTLAKDGKIEFSFENTYEEIPQIGDLKVSKVVTGVPETTPKAFSFTIDLTYPASADLSQVTLDGTCSSKAFTDASKIQVTASIKNGEYVLIKNLPVGTKFNVSESFSDSDYNTGSITQTLSEIKLNQTAVVTVENIHKGPEGSLSVTKSQSSSSKDQIPADQEFKIVVSFDDDIPNAVEDTDPSKVQGTLDKAGRKWTVNLKVGDVATLKGLPDSIGYTITEDLTGLDGYTAVDPVTGKIAANTDKSETIANSYTVPVTPGKLTVSKTVSGAPDTESEKTFDFRVTGPGGFDSSFSLKNGQSKTFDNLAKGNYTVTEQGTEENGSAWIKGYTLTVKDGNDKSVDIDDGSNEEVKFTNTYKKIPAPTSITPTEAPSASPTSTPTPTAKPGEPTPTKAAPSATPAAKPSASPTPAAKPSATPTKAPTVTPAPKPTKKPTPKPTKKPKPTKAPTPTSTPTPTETPTPTPKPTATPTVKPTNTPKPTKKPTAQPTDVINARRKRKKVTATGEGTSMYNIAAVVLLAAGAVAIGARTYTIYVGKKKEEEN